MLILAFGLIFLVLFYQNSFLKMKRKEGEALLIASLESEKNERHRIAADLHDGVCGDLGAINMYLQILKNDDTVKNQMAIDEIRESVENALENVRLVSYKLKPPLLGTFGLAAAVNDNFERLTAKTAIPFKLQCDKNPVLSVTVSYELFRVIQEFTTNMLKYGGITSCDVSITESTAAIIIEILDNGKPFNFTNALAVAKGSGLNNINSRLKVIGATLEQRDITNGNHFVIMLKN